MSQERTEEQKALTVATSVLAGGAIAMAICLLIMALGAWLIAGGTLSESWTTRGGLVGAFAGCLIGGGYTIRCVRSRALIFGLGVSVFFLLLWALAGLLFPCPGGATGAIPLILASALGGGLSGILFASRKKRRK